MAYIQETGRSYPNPIKGGGLIRNLKDLVVVTMIPHRTILVGTGMDYTITFEDGGPKESAYGQGRGALYW